MCKCDLDPQEYRFFLERITHSLRVPYFWFFASLTVVIEVCRVLIDYVTIVWTLGLSTDELVVYWINHWLVFLWPICMFLMYLSMKYLRNYTLHALKKIHSRLTEYPTYALEKVYCSRIQHLIPIGLFIICIFHYTFLWFSHGSYTFNSVSVEVTEVPLQFFHTVIWITYNWLIGGYFSWVCISTIIISYTTSKRVKHIDVFNFDRTGGFSAMGSLAMRTAVLYVFSVSFMFPGWIFFDPGFIALQLYALSGLVIVEFALFLLPMIFFHDKMKKAKEEYLIELDSHITDFYSHLTENTTSKEDRKEIECILKLRQIVESMHKYPFNLHMLAKVSSSAIFPSLIVVLQNAADIAKNPL